MSAAAALLISVAGSTVAPPAATSSISVTEPPAFGIDPVGDAALITASFTFGLLLELIIQTGELRPQEPLDPEKLLPIDRPSALADEEDRSSTILANIGEGLALAYGAVDVALALILDRGESPLAYGIMYLETAAVNLAVLNLVKIAVRRPRPVAYRELRRTGMVSRDTNSALSFYSGHAAITAGFVATATYLAFERNMIEGWVTLVIGTAVTVLVSSQRVQSGDHFATDVIAGAIAGASIGGLVPHLHRVAPMLRLAISADGDGAVLSAGATF